MKLAQEGMLGPIIEAVAAPREALQLHALAALAKMCKVPLIACLATQRNVLPAVLRAARSPEAALKLAVVKVLTGIANCGENSALLKPGMPLKPCLHAARRRCLSACCVCVERRLVTALPKLASTPLLHAHSRARYHPVLFTVFAVSAFITSGALIFLMGCTYCGHDLQREVACCLEGLLGQCAGVRAWNLALPPQMPPLLHKSRSPLLACQHSWSTTTTPMFGGFLLLRSLFQDL